MPGAGELRDRIRFERRGLDDNGDRGGPWAEVATVWAKVQPLRGGEGVQQARLQGSAPAILYVRASSDTRGIDNSYRAVDARDASRVWDITSAEISADRAFVEVLAVRKVGQVNV